MPTHVMKTHPIGPENRPGSVAEKLGVNPLSGTAPINRANLSADLLRYADEYDASLNRAQRQAARARRESEDRAVERSAKEVAVSKLLDDGIVPDGFAVVQYPTDKTATTTLGVRFGDGFHMIRTGDLQLATDAGFRVAPWPQPVEPEPEIVPPPNQMPAAPLAIVKHPNPTVTTDRGRDLSEGYRLVTVADLKYLASLGWQPSAWPAS